MARNAEDEVSDTVQAMLNDRGAGKTVCPSEVARLLSGPERKWRAHMADVHAAVDAMVAEGSIVLSWKGVRLGTRSGPYRIGKGQ